MKFLVTGSSGFVGSQVIKDLISRQFQVFSCYHKIKPKLGIPTLLDLSQTSRISQILKETSPDVIIHLAALTNLDVCETEKDMAYKLNSEATGVLAEEAQKNNIFFIYVSTDYVFDGEKGLNKESNQPDPISIYGKSKLDGETKVRKLASEWCIARTSTPFGMNQQKKSFPQMLIENLQKNIQTNIITDQFTSPTYLPNLSQMLIEIGMKKINGILHVSGDTRISRFDFAKLIAKKMEFNAKLLKPILMKEINWKAKRPKDSSLDVSKAKSILKEKPIKILESLEYFLQDVKSNANE